MLVRFSVVAFVDPEERIGLIGGPKGLGGWELSEAVPLVPCSVPRTHVVPTFWTAMVELPNSTDFEYKYVKWRRVPGLSCKSEREIDSEITADNETMMPVPTAELREEYSWLPGSGDHVEWEGSGSDDNRKFIFLSSEGAAANFSGNASEAFVDRVRRTPPECREHVFDSELNMLEHKETVWVAGDNRSGGESGDDRKVRWEAKSGPTDVYCLQSTPFARSLSEYQQTTYYYNTVKGNNDIHFNKVLDKVYVGTCPRNLVHFDVMKKDLQISTIMNFQAEEDIRHNWPDPQGYPSVETRTPTELYSIVRRTGLNYVWLPTTDMDTEARAQVAAQASWILAGLLANKETTGVYVHCNAGVGRSSSCVAGYMMNCLQLPLRRVNLLLCMRRNMAFFDGVAQAVGSLDYAKKFKGAAQLLKQPQQHSDRQKQQAAVANKPPAAAQVGTKDALATSGLA